MAEFEIAAPGTICLIQQTEDGRIMQLAMTKEQNNLLQLLIASMSTASPLIKMDPEYDLVLKNSLCKKCKNEK